MRRIWTSAALSALVLSGCSAGDGGGPDSADAPPSEDLPSEDSASEGAADESGQPESEEPEDEGSEPQESASEDAEDESEEGGEDEGAGAPGPIADADQVEWEDFTLHGNTRCLFEGDLSFGGGLGPGRAEIHADDEGADAESIYHEEGLGFELDYEYAEPLAIGPGGRDYLMVPFSCFVMNEEGDHWGTSASGWDNGFLLLGEEDDGSVVEVGSLNRSDERSGFDNAELADRVPNFDLQEEVEDGVFLAEETFYQEGDAGCCPEGQAWSLWGWDDDEGRVVRLEHSTQVPPSPRADSDEQQTEDGEEVDAGDPAGEIVSLEIEHGEGAEEVYAALGQATGTPASDFEQAASDPQEFGLSGEAMPEQYATMAGVIENRIVPGNPETDGYLEIDTTVRYGLEDMDRELSEADRQESSNEYNTYQHTGLPPGPITTPSAEALQAAAEPESTSYKYWTVVDGSTSEVKFAEDYATHQENAQEYQG